MVNPTDSAPRLEELLSHVEGLRALVRGLLGSEDQVEDVLQETWLIALRQRAAVNRAWLGTVARRLVSRRRRGEARRTSRERLDRGLAAEAPDTAVLQEREELRRKIADAVFALPEPHRRTLLLRFFEELEPIEIARSEGVPAGTIRSRIHRGLALLRERLDADTPGGREAWRALVLPLAGAPTLTATGAGVASTTPWILGGIMLTALVSTTVLAALGVFDRSDTEFTPSDREATTLTHADFASTPEPPEREIQVLRTAIERIEADPTAYRVDTLAPLASGGSAEALATQDTPGQVEIRVVDVRGQPIEKGWDARCLPYAQGEISSLRYLGSKQPKKGVVKLLEVPPGGYVVWVWFDVGVRSEESMITVKSDAKSAVTCTCPIDLERTLAIRLTPPRGPGVSFVSFDAASVERGDPPKFETARLIGNERTYEDPIVSGGITALLRFEDVEPGTYEFRMEDPRFENIEVKNLRPGAKVEEVRLRGSSAVRLFVRDAANKRAVVSYQVHDGTEGTLRQGNVKPLVKVTQPKAGSERRPGEARIGDLLPGDRAFEIRADGYAKQRFVVKDLDPREVRDVEIQLQAAIGLEGVVVDATGSPVSGAFVGLYRRAEQDDSNESIHFTRTSKLGGIEEALVRWEVASALTDGEGRFTMSSVPGGDYVLRAVSPEARYLTFPKATVSSSITTFSSYMKVDALRECDFPSPMWRYSPAVVVGFQDVRIEEGTTTRASIAFPATAAVKGTVLLGDDPPEGTAWVRAFRGDAERAPLIAQAKLEDGRFDLRYLPAGEHRFVLVWEQRQEVSSSNVGTTVVLGGFQFAPTPLGSIELELGAMLERVFDARAETPTQVQLAVSFTGANAPPNVQVMLRRQGDTRIQGVIPISLDRSGRAKSPPISPGTYDVAIQTMIPSLFHRIPEPLVLSAGKNPPFEIEITLHQVEVQCLDAANGEPLANTPVFLDGVDHWKGTISPILPRMTNAEGRVALKLPAGEFAMVRQGQRSMVLQLPEGAVRLRVSEDGKLAPQQVRLKEAK